MDRAVCFGEIMLRLNPEGYLKIKQADKFMVSYAGGEANVAVSLANYGVDAKFVTKLPKNDLGISAVRDLRANNVDTSDIVYGGDRIGVYFLEKGASQRPSKVIYDRKYSAISMADSSDFDWDKILDGVEWFHFTGITPALSDNLVQICKEAIQTAKRKGIVVSCDLNYRKNLWSEEKAKSVMQDFMQYVDVCIANEEDAEKCLGIHPENTDVTAGELDNQGYIDVAKKITQKYGCKQVAITLRRSITASDNNWAAMLYRDGQAYFSKNYLIHLVDRVGGGDSFAGALIYALMKDYPSQQAIEFAVAASCLKHTIEYDFNMVTVDEVMSLVNGNSTGRVQR